MSKAADQPALKGEMCKWAATKCQTICSWYVDAVKADLDLDRKACKAALAARVQGAKDKAGEAVDKGKEAVGKAGDAVKGAADKAGEAVKGAVDKVKGGKGEPAAQGESATFNSMSVNSILESVNFA